MMEHNVNLVTTHALVVLLTQILVFPVKLPIIEYLQQIVLAKMDFGIMEPYANPVHIPVILVLMLPLVKPVKLL